MAERCRVYRVGLWQCPHFLFIVMGFVIIVAIVATHLVASVYAEPEVSLSIVFAVTIVLFIISHAVVNAFDKVATASQLKSEFIAILSHELRNPLSAIKWQINSLTSEKLADGEEKLVKGLNIIGGENERMIRLVGDLLDVNRIEEGTLVMAPAVFSLAELTRRAVEDYLPYARASNLSLNVFAPKAEFRVRADEGRIKSVLSRLIDNAIRYSVSAGEISISLEDLGDKVRWSVKDQGTGVPVREVDRVFSKFFRATNILRYQTNGLGVGLYLAKHVVEASGGEIGFRTLEGHGSTFFFTLPASRQGGPKAN